MDNGTARYFFKCPACKAKFAADIEATSPVHRVSKRHLLDRAVSFAQRAACPDCGHKPAPRFHIIVGHVRRPYAWEMYDRQRKVEERLAPPCDGRCTNATGPNCECICGGKNHGSRRLVVVRTELAQGDQHDTAHA